MSFYKSTSYTVGTLTVAAHTVLLTSTMYQNDLYTEIKNTGSRREVSKRFIV